MPENVNAQIDYDSVLAELYAKRDEIEVSINTILFLRGSGSTASIPGTVGGTVRSVSGTSIPSNAFFSMSLVDAAKKCIELKQARLTLPQIVKGLEEGGMPAQKLNTVYAALRRRESQTGDIKKVGEEWGLKEWFSGISVGKPATKSTKSKKRRKKTAKKAKPTANARKAEAGDAGKPEEPKAATPEKVRPISILNAAYEVLTKEDAPLHAEILAQRVNEGYGKNTNLKSLAASLPDDSTQRFSNIGNNTWALDAWAASKKVKTVAAAAG